MLSYVVVIDVCWFGLNLRWASRCDCRAPWCSCICSLYQRWLLCVSKKLLFFNGWECDGETTTKEHNKTHAWTHEEEERRERESASYDFIVLVREEEHLVRNDSVLKQRQRTSTSFQQSLVITMFLVSINKLRWDAMRMCWSKRKKERRGRRIPCNVDVRANKWEQKSMSNEWWVMQRSESIARGKEKTFLTACRSLSSWSMVDVEVEEEEEEGQRCRWVMRKESWKMLCHRQHTSGRFHGVNPTHAKMSLHWWSGSLSSSSSSAAARRRVEVDVATVFIVSV